MLIEGPAQLAYETPFDLFKQTQKPRVKTSKKAKLGLFSQHY